MEICLDINGQYICKISIRVTPVFTEYSSKYVHLEHIRTVHSHYALICELSLKALWVFKKRVFMQALHMYHLLIYEKIALEQTSHEMCRATDKLTCGTCKKIFFHMHIRVNMDSQGNIVIARSCSSGKFCWRDTRKTAQLDNVLSYTGVYVELYIHAYSKWLNP